MENIYEERALSRSSGVGILALLVWAIYILLSLASLPDIPYRMMISSFFGLLACAALLGNFRHWRLAVLLACCVYIVVYAVQIFRMTGMMAGADTPLLSALSLYYSASWTVTQGVFIERGVLGGLTHGFFEYAMPILVAVLIFVTAFSRRKKPTASYAG